MKTKISAYEAPAVMVLGKVEQLTLGCGKNFGGSDGFTWQVTGEPIGCASP